MYSGTTIRTKSGRILGVHQRIDRLERRKLRHRTSKSLVFPTISQILHFEGLNGPDGIKRKSPSVDEPWHHIDPTNPEDTAILGLIHDHIYNLSSALREDNMERAGFEAAWLAHAVTDGLTPAHHDDLGGKIEELWGKAHHERDSVRDKTIIRGDDLVDTFKKNWKYWGGGGVFTAHIMFEWGVAMTIGPVKFGPHTGANANDIIRLEKNGFEALFYESLRKIHAMNMYEEFGKKGWTHELAAQTKDELIPEIVKAVTLAWYQAVLMAEQNHAN
jgi:hypothetical protein